jgi:hypothetical protein
LELEKSRWCSWLSRGSHKSLTTLSVGNPKVASSSLARDNSFLLDHHGRRQDDRTLDARTSAPAFDA